MSKKDRNILIIIFAIFFLISFFTPITGDDWGNYITSKSGLRAILGSTIGMYFNWEGRLISRFFINLFTCPKILYNIIFSLLMVIVIFFTSKVEKKNRLFIILLMTLSMLLINNSIFTQTYLWVAGSITYFMPTALIAIYLFVYFKFLNNSKKYKKIYYVISSLFSFFIVMFVENIACAYIVLNILLLILYIHKYKKVNSLLILNIVFSTSGFIIMMLSPGTKYRNSIENIDFNKLSVFKKVEYNYPNLIIWTFAENAMLLILMNILNFIKIKKLNVSVLNKITLHFVSFISIVFMIIFNLMKYRILDISYNFGIIYFTFFGMLSVFLLLYQNDSIKRDLVLLFTGLFCNVVMLISPIYSARTALFTVVFLYILYVLNISRYINKEKMFSDILVVIIGMVTVILLTAYFNLFRFSLFQHKSVIEQRKNNQIVVYTSPSFLVHGLTPYSDYHVKVFKNYYKIKKEKQIIYKESKWKFFIFFDKKETIK